MSRTLFIYILKDLLRIFLMASGVLAGIMSFGGLLRPLTEHGLSATQVGMLIRYFQPAMTAYSFPIAALFAATMTYGRLSSDNELTACRASGISYLSLAAPAAVLGLTVALISLWMLCFIVPVYNLKIEQVIYENMAQLVQNQIERTHQMELGDLVISASEAQVLQPDKVSYAGVETNIEPHASDGSTGWRVPGKPDHLSAANEITGYYGMDGYALFGVGDKYKSLPGYVQNFSTSLPSNSTAGYAAVDDPTQPGQAVRSGILYQADLAPRQTTTMFSFTLIDSAPSTVRIGLLYDNADNSLGGAGIRLSVSNGIVTASTTTLPSDGNPQWYFFDLIGPGTYTVSETNATTSKLTASIGGIAFDATSDEQCVRLKAPVFISYNTENDPDAPTGHVRVPREYWTADSAIAYIKPMGETVRIRAHADQGVKFQRTVQAVQSEKMNAQTVDYGDIEMASPIREQPKFKTIGELHELLENPQKSKKLQELMVTAIAREERTMLYKQIVEVLNTVGYYDFREPEPPANAAGLPQVAPRMMRLVRGEPPAVMPPDADQLILNSAVGSAPGGQVKLQQLDDTGKVMKEDRAVQWRLHADPDVVAPGQVEKSPDRQIVLKIEGFDVRVDTPDEPAVRASVDQSYAIATPPDIRACETHSAEFYMETRLPNFSTAQREELTVEYRRLVGKMHGEVHSRAAFSVSCVVLVLVGCALGMMFKSGNLLTAFAVSFMPALLGIALIITGQQLAANSKNLQLGLTVLWSGNAMVLVLAVWLLGRLQRT